MDSLLFLAEIAGALTGIVACICLIVRPIREKILGLKHVIDGQKCLLRSDMLGIYYRHREAKKIRQYEYENFLFAYEAYKALGGNSFIDDICEDVRDWDIIT